MWRYLLLLYDCFTTASILILLLILLVLYYGFITALLLLYYRYVDTNDSDKRDECRLLY